MSDKTKVIAVSNQKTNLSRSASLTKTVPSNNKVKLSRTPSKQLKQSTNKHKQQSPEKKKFPEKKKMEATKEDAPKKNNKLSKNKRQSSPPMTNSDQLNTSQSASTFQLSSKKSTKQDTRGRRRSSSVIEIRKNTTIYAGPTFNNAPAPSSIPIPPAFSPTLVSIELMKKEQEAEYLVLENHSRELMNQLNHPPPLVQYNSNHSHHFYNRLHNHQFHQYYPCDKDLSEIQRDLRSLLKI